MYLSWVILTCCKGYDGWARVHFLAACSMGQATPAGALLSSMIFAFFDGLSNILQVLKIPSEFIQMLPYLATIAGLTVYSIQKSAAASRKMKKIKEVQG
ncbi:hypothetical protein [Enterocloster sp.]|uniref:hypothetical protein n=1 Tax=Enterocloster sp. TaxID=2719315 RepID=UPI0039A36A8B